MFYKKAVLKNYTKLTVKQLCWSPFLIKLQVVRAATLLKRDRCFPVYIAKFLRIAILKNIRERLLLTLTDFSEQLVFREAFFRTAYLTYLFLTFILLLFHLIHLFH